jgi:hypothetical protein
MKFELELSLDDIGAICNALETTFPLNSEEIQTLHYNLSDYVYNALLLAHDNDYAITDSIYEEWRSKHDLLI